MADDGKTPKDEKEVISDPSGGGDGETVHLKIYSPYKQYFDGPAKSVSAESATGPFDILPKHHNFITLLEPCDVVIQTPSGEEAIRIDGGVMHVKADDIIIFLDV